MCVYVCVYVCVYIRHAQEIAKLFFSVRSTQFPFKLIILFIKKYINLLGPKTLRKKKKNYFAKRLRKNVRIQFLEVEMIVLSQRNLGT